jgi:membrane protein DedA with SNARE-associated domain/rhodanese-related sulfurtransferase
MEIAKHGYIVLFVWLTAEQLGAPVPAAPMLIAAGVLSVTGQLTFTSALVIAVLGCLLGDSAWYVFGKLRGSQVLRILCKISLNPETCVRRSSEFISRNGGRSLVVAKFVPGIGSVAVPLAANSGISLGSFFFYDIIGSMLYAGAYLAAGRLLGDRIDRLSGFANSIKSISLALAILAALAILGWRFYQRQRFRSDLNMARISPEDVLELINGKQNPFIVDLRHPLDMLTDPRVIPGAIRMTPDELSGRQSEIPIDREIILYCTCPNEASSVTVALKLRRMGITRVRPLLGGFDEWKQRGYPLEEALEKIGWRTATSTA